MGGHAGPVRRIGQPRLDRPPDSQPRVTDALFPGGGCRIAARAEGAPAGRAGSRRALIVRGRF